MDSNHRGVMNTTDLQSAAFNLSATSPNFVEVYCPPNRRSRTHVLDLQ